MMTPEDISAMTLDALREARTTLMSAEWALEMDAATPETRRAGGLLLGTVQGEILRLENAQLASLASALSANGARLEAAAKDVKKEVKKIANVARILKTVDQLVKLAIKVVPKAFGLMGAARGAARPRTKVATKKRAAKKVAKKKPAASKPAARRKSAATSRGKTGPRRRAR